MKVRNLIIYGFLLLSMVVSGYSSFVFGVVVSDSNALDVDLLFVSLGALIFSNLVMFLALRGLFGVAIGLVQPLLVVPLACGVLGVSYDRLSVPEGVKLLLMFFLLLLVGLYSGRLFNRFMDCVKEVENK